MVSEVYHLADVREAYQDLARRHTRSKTGIWGRPGKSPLEQECVVADAVSIEPVSYPNSLLTGKFTGNFVEGGALAGSSRYNHT